MRLDLKCCSKEKSDYNIFVIIASFSRGVGRGRLPLFRFNIFELHFVYIVDEYWLAVFSPINPSRRNKLRKSKIVPENVP